MITTTLIYVTSLNLAFSKHCRVNTEKNTHGTISKSNEINENKKMNALMSIKIHSKIKCFKPEFKNT